MNLSMSEYGLKLIGNPYVWGGNTPEQGLDCSGFICLILRAFSWINQNDYSSQQLHDILSIQSVIFPRSIKQDDVLFFGSSVNKIDHIAMAINEWQLVESSGEGKINTDRGFVRIMPINHRSDLCAIIRLPAQSIQG